MYCNDAISTRVPQKEELLTITLMTKLVMQIRLASAVSVKVKIRKINSWVNPCKWLKHYKHLKVLVSLAKGSNRGMNRSQCRVHWSKNCPTVPVGDEWLGDRGDDAHGGLGTDLLKSLINGAQPQVVDDLGILHRLTRSDIEPRHIASNIGITDDGHQSCHDAWETQRTRIVPMSGNGLKITIIRKIRKS